jgi:hypothetical protein
VAKARRPLTTDDDTIAMRRVIAWCAANGADVRRTSPNQIKVGPLNCWPDSGAWNRDDDPKRKGGGVPAFMAAVQTWMVDQSLVASDWS